jgi:hypothetical protein
VQRVSRHERLLTLLERVPDPWKARGKRHRLAALPAVAVCAVLTGAKSFVAIEEWVADAPAGLLTRVGLRRSRVAERTLRRVFSVLDVDLLDRLLGAWTATRLITVGDRRVYAIDGKTLRGARSKDTAAPHLVAALVHGAGTVAGQAGVDSKTNEIPTAQELITTMAVDIGITDAVITMDALHTSTRPRR